MDEDWRGLDSEWLLRVTRRLLQSLDEAGSVEAILAGVGREELEVAFSDVRACLDAVALRTIRPIMRSSTLDLGSYPADGRSEALASELGGGRGGVQHLSLPELMTEHPDDPARGWRSSKSSCSSDSVGASTRRSASPTGITAATTSAALNCRPR